MYVFHIIDFLLCIGGNRVENKKKKGTNKRNIKGKESNSREQKFNDASNLHNRDSSFI